MNQLCIFTVQINAALLSRNYIKTLENIIDPNLNTVCVINVLIELLELLLLSLLLSYFSLFYKKKCFHTADMFTALVRASI